MKKIKTINKLLSSLTLLSPLSGIGFNSQYQSTQKVITENSNNSLNYIDNQANAEQRTMGDVTVTVEGTVITNYVSGGGKDKTLLIDSDITEIQSLGYTGDGYMLDFQNAKNLKVLGENIFHSSANVSILNFSKLENLESIGDACFAYMYQDDNFFGEDKIVIHSKLKTIGNGAFDNYYSKTWSNVTNVDLSQATSLTSIGSEAFGACKNLIKIPDLSNLNSLKSLGSECFANFTKNTRTTIILPQNIEDLGSGAFSNSNVTEINYDKCKYFKKATNLGPEANVIMTGSNVADGIWKDNSKCVTDLSFGDVILPPYLNQLTNAFSRSNISSIDLSSCTNITSIPKHFIFDCNQFSQNTNLVIPYSVTELHDAIFYCNQANDIIFFSNTTPSYDYGMATYSWAPKNLFGNVYVKSGLEQEYKSLNHFIEGSVTNEKIIGWTFDSSQSTISGNFSELDIKTDVGQSLNQFALNGGCSPEVISNYSAWELVPVNDTKEVPNGLYISKGNIFWNNVSSGSYEFKIRAKFNEVDYKDSDEIIKINVNNNNINTSLILGLVLGLGIPIILAAGFGVWYLKKKKK